MRFILVILIFFISTTTSAELLRPNPNLLPKEIISIQLISLQKNNIPYNNAGIEQNWEFAHPSNRLYTGPLSKFTNMMYSPSYIIMLDHLDHKIIYVNEKEYTAYYFIELIDKNRNKFGFQWTLKKVLMEGKFKNCWMTLGVSLPITLKKYI